VEATVYFSTFTINYILEEDCVKLIQEEFIVAKEFLTAKLGSGTSKWLWRRLHEDNMIGKMLGPLRSSKFWQLDKGSGTINTLDLGQMLSASRDDFSTNIQATLRLLFSFGEDDYGSLMVVPVSFLARYFLCYSANFLTNSIFQRLSKPFRWLSIQLERNPIKRALVT
jgi:hypothetical protein